MNMNKKQRRIFAIFCILTLTLSLYGTALATDDPLEVVNNLSSFIQPDKSHRHDYIGVWYRAGGLVIEKPRRFSAGNGFSHRCRRHCDMLCTRNPGFDYGLKTR